MEKVIEKLNKEAGNDKELKKLGKYIIEYIKANPAEIKKVAVKDKTLTGAVEEMRKVAIKNQKNGYATICGEDEEGFGIIEKYYGFTGNSTEPPKPQTVAPAPAPSDSGKLAVSLDDLL